MIPFINLQQHHTSLKSEFLAAIEEVIDTSAFAGGAFVNQFERDFAAYCGTQYAIGVGSGTEALWLTLLAMNIGPGDEVITVPTTFMATAEAISMCGARPVFVDIDESTYNMDPAKLEEAICHKTKAIIPVHLFGQMADMDPILEIARRHRLYVLEDASQAHGATYKGKRAGNVGHIGCFSFYPGKNLGAFGEAGAVVTNNPDFEEKVRILRDHGQAEKYVHSHIGWNGRMDGIQGAVLRIKLRGLDKCNQMRRERAALYNELLAQTKEVITPKQADYGDHVYHLYAIRVPQRDALMAYLKQKNIICGIHYPIPIHLQQAYRFLGLLPGDYPVSERCAQEFLSLPMYPELTREEVSEVATALVDYFK